MPQARRNNTNLPLCLCDGKIRDNFTVDQYVPAILSRGTVMGKRMLVAGAVTPNPGNAGDGVVDNFALAATPGALAKVGTYTLRCSDPLCGDALSAAVTNFVGVGDGTVTLPVAALPAKQGEYSLECIDEEGGDTLVAVAGACVGVGDGTVTIPTAALPAKQGAYLLECTDEESNDDLSITAVVATRVGISDGTLTGEAISAVGAPTKQGDWICECMVAAANGGIFRLIDPDGIVVGSHIEILGGAGGTAVWDGAGITFTLTDGAADFDVGDYFTITVIGEHGGRFQLIDPDGIMITPNIFLPGGAAGAAAVVAGGLTFTLTDGATDFEVGDNFTITVTGEHGGIFRLTDPDGIVLTSSIALPGTAGGDIAVDVGGLGFLLTDGATDFEVGDVFTITVIGEHGGVFELTDPSGIVIENHIQLPGTPGGAVTVTIQGITFRIADGATDFVVHDSFTLTVLAGSMLAPVSDGAVADGSNLPLFILAHDVDARADISLNNTAYVKGSFDAQQLAFINTATLATNIIIDGIVKTIREWLDDVGLVAVDSNYIDGFENV